MISFTFENSGIQSAAQLLNATINNNHQMTFSGKMRGGVQHISLTLAFPNNQKDLVADMVKEFSHNCKFANETYQFVARNWDINSVPMIVEGELCLRS